MFGRFAPRLQQAIVARLGWTSLRPVQELAGEVLLDGHNAVILAPTAGGKTEASMFPVLSMLVSDQPEGIGALYIAPIKALLNNQSERLDRYTQMVGLGRFVWHGDTASHDRRRFLREPSELLMTTPESLEVMLISQKIDKAKLFADLRVVVIDEVHAMAGSDRGAHLLSVIERLAALSRHDIQRVGLSATVGNPSEIVGWLQGSSKRPGTIVDPPHAPARRELLVLRDDSLPALADSAAGLAKIGKSLFFCQSRAIAEAVAEHMRRAGTEVFVHHSSVSAEERQLAEERFHRGSSACIVCTSTLELGIDVGDLDRVFQAEAPTTVSSFLQRMGRTGRRDGTVANTTFFCETDDGMLQALAMVELAKTRWVEAVELSDRAWPVLVHQLLALSLATDGVAPEAAWAHLQRVPDFAGIRRPEFDRLIQWMLRDGGLRMASGLLVIGPKAERRFGRRNFMELYAVFSSPKSYSVQTSHGQLLGSLNQQFVDRLVDGVSCFLLAGRPWAVISVQHDDRRVVVQAAPRGRKPTWGGFLPQFLGFEVCQQIARTLCSDDDYVYLHSHARDALQTIREQYQSVRANDGLLQPGGIVEFAEDELRWWTFAGGRINATLRYALEAISPGWKVVPDNFVLRIRGEVEVDSFRAAKEQLEDPEFWGDDAIWRSIAASLPNYRLSKFQPLMPPWIEREMVADYLLDVGGTWRWLTGEAGVGLSRVPAAVRRAPAHDVAPPVAVERDDTPPRLPTLPVRWIDGDQQLRDVCERLRHEDAIALDVETTLYSRRLCLVQLGTREEIFIIDPFEIVEFEPLVELLGDEGVVKVIHNASFEKSVLAVHGVEIRNIADTLALSRARRGREIEGGHKLGVVCERELGIELDKSEQQSDWARRPLSKRQMAYAALDVEVLLGLWDRLQVQGRLF
ncbi:DEAD/DEAH box helicase [Enhygromyxa salina]|uniref:Ribonuclease D n=1 Tax=Enhygromyxa salina TaxID=215803 RepID=A0A2S9YJ58_9BACT|nr:DEAD/DEAH box helicase [Enhygromyxa salina]PRQ05139.1 Ribonuclease D [Enhygromyxa salina]